MRRISALLATLCLVLALFAPTATAAQQQLPVLSHKFYPMRDLVFVDFHNANFSAIDNIVVNMVIREGTGRNRVLAIGQTFLPPGMVLAPGEHASARVPIRARVVRDIPLLAQFEFHISGRQLDNANRPPDVVVNGSSNGITLEFNRDADGVPIVLGFIGVNPDITAETQAQVQAAVLTFYDKDRRVVWSEIMPINTRLTNNDSFMIWGKYDHITKSLVPEIETVEAKFVVGNGR